MTLQHTALLFAGVLPMWAKIGMFTAGGITFPIFAFLLVDGYNKTSNFNKYSHRLLIFALIAQIPYTLVFASHLQTFFSLNVLFTLFLGLGMLKFFDRVKKLGFETETAFCFFVIAFGLTGGVYLDWGVCGLFVILLFHRIKSKIPRYIFPPLVAGGTMFGLAWIRSSLNGYPDLFLFFGIGAVFAIPLLLAYSGERGKDMRYFFYGFYPAHLFILAVISILLGMNNVLGLLSF